MFGVLVAVLAVAWGTCPDPVGPLEQAERDVLAFELDDADTQLDAVVRALGCGAPVSAEVHRRYWLATGVRRSYGEDFDAAAIAFAASKRRVAEWNTDFGLAQPDPEGSPISEYTRWTQAQPGTTLHPLQLEALPAEGRVWVDGVLLEQPYQLAEGAHLLQVGIGDKAFFASALMVDGAASVQVENVPEVVTEAVAVASDDGVVVAEPTEAQATEGDPSGADSTPEAADDADSTVSGASHTVVTPKGGLLPTGGVTPALPAASGPTVLATGSARSGVIAVKRRRHPSRGLLVSGLVLGVLGGGGLGTAGVIKGNYDEPDQGLFLINQAAGWSGWGLVGVGGTLIGTSFLVNKW